YLYCGIVDFQSQKNEIILELLVAADEFGIQRLINSVQEFLIQNCYKFLRSDPIKMLDLVICHNAFVNLKTVFLETLTKNCKDFLRKDPIKIMNFIIYRDEFNEFRKVSLEIICENPELLFNSDEYVSLEKGVLIFHQINGEEFMFEVWPYRHLISDNLIEDILHYFLVSNAVSHYNVFPVRWGNIKLDTVLVNKNFILLLSKWIDKKIIDDKSLKEIRYDFNLLFRSSIDGYSSRIFHQRCDNKGATIVIAKMSDSNMLVGGYNPLDWNGNNYKCTEDSFIFLLNDLNNLQSAKIGRVTNCNYAVYCNNDYGPNFGGGHDLYAPNNSRNWYCSSNSNILSIHCYPIIGIPYSFTISDYEVFQVVKN
ncbi:25123_t:CDS:2, partial [Gigaspora rosea]